jgi:hypothetical protein
MKAIKQVFPSVIFLAGLLGLSQAWAHDQPQGGRFAANV